MKYIGFDCDECLAQVEQLMPFTESDAKNEIFIEFAKKITDSNIPFIRPTFWQLLEKINEEKMKGNVKLFIYSNNGSLKTLQFIALLVDLKLDTYNFFDTVAHYDNDLRTDNINGQYIKRWDSMKIFIDKSFNTNVLSKDVMFFDDMPHPPLKNELMVNYIKVKPYEYPPIKIDNDILLELWEQSGGDPRFIDTEDVYKTAEYDESENEVFIDALNIFLKKLGGKRKKRKTLKNNKYRINR